MPTQLHLSILSGTYKFHRFYKLWAAVCDFTLYAWQNRYGASKYVAIYQTSRKCYRVMYGDAWNVREKDWSNASAYNSFRTQYELCRYLDTLV